ncbi:thiol reductant ABC exporter subunit CydC [Lederbergia sp. NSJ-179]|uniref:thiol reductant ABC exporter subunit CydC n=1 Tax=Lederbergia sp. NSJ-179 TaxID=2931402 RepID=UPI001FD32528|nr:thiol reductant ABC exporter subunit CydC [Lederbergia sp. NSJ-179]MCJ7843334.1 thiol reductant ABC exporter subunit CydC [Lederbergia sp. NSJ-179]
MKLFHIYIKPYLKQYKGVMLATIFLGILTAVASSLLTFTSGYLITRASERPETILLLYIPIVGVRAFGISKAVTRYVERLLGHHAVLKILGDMRVTLYGMLEPQALFVRSRFQTGDLLGTLADDIEHLQDVYIRTLFPTATALFLFIYSVVALALFDWLFALWMAILLSIIVFVYPLLSLFLLKKRQMRLKANRKQAYQSLTDAFFGIHDWIVSGRKTSFMNKFMQKTMEGDKIEKEIVNWHQSRTFQLQVLSGIILLFVGVWAGVAAGKGEIMPTYIAAFTLVVFPIMEGLIPLSDAIEKVPDYQESLQRIEDVRQFANEKTEILSQSFESVYPSIRLQHVSYHYPNEHHAALEDISLSIPFGQKIAILGKSGAGKSTLLQLLLGVLTPNSGKVEIGEIDPEKYGEDIFSGIGFLNQKPYLFATTIANNIRLGKQNATEQEIKKVMEQVKLDQYIQSLPKGMNTQMEEAGQRFSGGERQRIALARILLKNTPIVILDEPTVGLDPATERDLLATMFKTLENKTMIMITHHLMGLEKMDQIIFLDEGRIAMQGTHTQLMTNNERYRQLYALDH